MISPSKVIPYTLVLLMGMSSGSIVHAFDDSGANRDPHKVALEVRCYRIAAPMSSDILAAVQKCFTTQIPPKLFEKGLIAISTGVTPKSVQLDGMKGVEVFEHDSPFATNEVFSIGGTCEVPYMHAESDNRFSLQTATVNYEFQVSLVSDSITPIRVSIQSKAPAKRDAIPGVSLFVGKPIECASFGASFQINGWEAGGRVAGEARPELNDLGPGAAKPTQMLFYEPDATPGYYFLVSMTPVKVPVQSESETIKASYILSCNIARFDTASEKAQVEKLVTDSSIAPIRGRADFIDAVSPELVESIKLSGNALVHDTPILCITSNDEGVSRIALANSPTGRIPGGADVKGPASPMKSDHDDLFDGSKRPVVAEFIGSTEAKPIFFGEFNTADLETLEPPLGELGPAGTLIGLSIPPEPGPNGVLSLDFVYSEIINRVALIKPEGSRTSKRVTFPSQREFRFQVPCVLDKPFAFTFVDDVTSERVVILMTLSKPTTP